MEETLMELRIDERTWEGGGESRKLEWQAAIRELVDPIESRYREGIEQLLVTMSEQGFQLTAQLIDEDALIIDIRHDQLETLIHEYVDTVRQIARADLSGGVLRLEALDMAKKVTHDKAGRFLERRCRPLALDHPTARRMFTLLLAMRIDTTRLVGVHGHRRI
ncbi:MAG: hypothetical protein ACI9KE_006360 [Polyangiales bacterium]